MQYVNASIDAVGSNTPSAASSAAEFWYPQSKFRPNLQRVRVKLPSGQVKRLWVSAKAIKAGKIQKA